MPARDICPNVVVRAFRHVSIAYVLFALLAVLFVAPFVWFRGMRTQVIDADPFLILVALGIGAALVALALRFPSHAECSPASRRRFRLMAAAVGVGLFVVQIALLSGGFFITDWDAYQLALTAFDPSTIATDAGANEYYSRNGNQVFLMSVFAGISQIAKMLGQTTFAASYFAMAAVGCACIAVSTVLVSCLVERIGGARAGALALVLAVLLCGLSPWLFVPYSDSYGIVCPTIVLFSYVCVRRRAPRAALIGFFSVLGYLVKPTAIFVCAAILFVEALAAFSYRRADRRKSAYGKDRRGKSISLRDEGAVSCAAQGEDSCARAMSASCGDRRCDGCGDVRGFILCTALPFVVAAAVAFALSAVATVPYKAQVDPSKGFSMTHFLMMGANEESNGRWTPDEYALSASIDDPQKRSAANIEVWKNRIAEMGPSGVAALAVKKTVNTYLDGSFWWEGEGAFYQEVLGESALVKDFYNIGYAKNWETSGADNPTPYFHLAQIVWLFVLVGCVLSWFVRRPTNAECVIACTLLALSAFLVIFECRARYLFLYTPFFVALASLGWQGVVRAIRSYRMCAHTSSAPTRRRR